MERYSSISADKIAYGEPETKIELRHSKQDDDIYAWFVNGKKLLTTTAGWDGPHELAIWKGFPRRITKQQALNLARRHGIPQKFVQIWIEESMRGFQPFDRLQGAGVEKGKVLIERPGDRLIMIPESELDNYVGGPGPLKMKEEFLGKV